jgi:hypothetical protein
MREPSVAVEPLFPASTESLGIRSYPGLNVPHTSVLG